MRASRAAWARRPRRPPAPRSRRCRARGGGEGRRAGRPRSAMRAAARRRARPQTRAGARDAPPQPRRGRRTAAAAPAAATSSQARRAASAGLGLRRAPWRSRRAAPARPPRAPPAESARCAGARACLAGTTCRWPGPRPPRGSCGPAGRWAAVARWRERVRGKGRHGCRCHPPARHQRHRACGAPCSSCVRRPCPSLSESGRDSPPRQPRQPRPPRRQRVPLPRRGPGRLELLAGLIHGCCF
mmetsp:Transcript_488/g.1393  ORF Transcript_488/g.1393 Transcript_488/m.1393 type:complete len:242 (-) Transcript_488:355-1080(-)